MKDLISDIRSILNPRDIAERIHSIESIPNKAEKTERGIYYTEPIKDFTIIETVILSDIGKLTIPKLTAWSIDRIEDLIESITFDFGEKLNAAYSTLDKDEFSKGWRYIDHISASIKYGDINSALEQITAPKPDKVSEVVKLKDCFKNPNNYQPALDVLKKVGLTDNDNQWIGGKRQKYPIVIWWECLVNEGILKPDYLTNDEKSKILTNGINDFSIDAKAFSRPSDRNIERFKYDIEGLIKSISVT